MQITINGTSCTIPSDVSNISLGKFVEWQTEHGKALDEELAAILKEEYADELQQVFALEDHLLKEGIAWYSFFTGYDFETIRNTENADALLEQYSIIRNLLKESEEQAHSFPLTFTINDEQWVINDWKVNPGSTMTFNEIITSKEVMRQLQTLGQGKWDALIYLCAIFLRKEGEDFKDEFIQEGSDRLAYMNELPLNYALTVGFFLSACVNIWLSTSQYSLAREAAAVSLN